MYGSKLFLSNWKYWCEKTTILKCNGELFFDIFYLDCIVPLPIKKITFSWCDIASTICKLFSYFHLSLLSFTFNSKLLLFVYRWVYFKPNESWNLGYDTLYCIIHLFYVHKGLVDPFWYSYFSRYTETGNFVTVFIASAIQEEKLKNLLSLLIISIQLSSVPQLRSL